MSSEKEDIKKFAENAHLKESGLIRDVSRDEVISPLEIRWWGEKMFFGIISVGNFIVPLFGKVSSLEKLKEVSKAGVHAEIHGRYVKIDGIEFEDVFSWDSWIKK
jgi:hypothetical protein